MPFVTIKVAGPTLATDQIRCLQHDTTRLMADILRKQPGLTAVLVEQVSVVGWTVGAETVQAAAHLEVTVTAGTNTTEEKAKFISAAMRLLRSVVGSSLNPVTYIVVHEVPGSSWGWDGLTQAHRAQAKAG